MRLYAEVRGVSHIYINGEICSHKHIKLPSQSKICSHKHLLDYLVSISFLSTFFFFKYHFLEMT